MAWIKERKRASGTTAYGVRYEVDGTQTMVTFDDKPAAEEFCDAVNRLGPEKAMRAFGITKTKRAAARSTAPTVAEWLAGYIASRTGVTKSTIYDYNSYLKLDIAPVIGDIPIDLLTPNDVAGWVQHLADRELAGKTIANRHGFLSAALNVAVQAPHHLIQHNPALGTRIPRTEQAEMCFLSHAEFTDLLTHFTERWRPMVAFMVASGARFGELSALRPSDVDLSHNTVRIARAWKRTYDAAGHELGATKTMRSDRTISVAANVLADLDYTGEWLFTNTVNKPVRASSFRNNVWYPAVAKARKAGLAKKPRIHDMRHTCASWMIAGGANMYAVQRHLGHESIQTTINRYSHLDRKDAEAAADIIGKALGRP